MLACYKRNLNSPTVGELARSTWLHSDVNSADSEGRSASCLLFDFALSTKEAERGQPFTHRPTPALVYVSAAVPAGCTPARSDDPRSGHWQGEVIGTEDGAGCKAGQANSEKTDGFFKKMLENGDKASMEVENKNVEKRSPQTTLVSLKKVGTGGS